MKIKKGISPAQVYKTYPQIFTRKKGVEVS